MADVVISYSRENEATVRQLADAVAGEGYQVWRDDSAVMDASSADTIAEQIGRAKAVIVVWSEAAGASDWVKAEANVARGMKKLVQASADDRPPPIPFDPGQVASISSWLGQPDHPGWQRIKADLAALCGAPDPDKTVLAFSPVAAAPPVPPSAAPVAPPAPVAAPAAAPPAPATPPPAPATPATALAPAGSVPPARKSKGALIAVILVLLLAAGAAGAWFMTDIFKTRSADSALTSQLPGADNQAAPAPVAPPPVQTVNVPPPVAVPEVEPVEEQFTQESVMRTGAAFLRSAPDGGGLNVARISAGEVFTTYQQDGEWWRVRTASGATGYLRASDIRPRAAAVAEARATEERRRRPTGPRINRANSEVMQAFCENAGRGTPQCRRFRQQVRDQRR